MGSAFPTTRWNLVLQAGRGDDTEARAAMDALCEAYWFPLYAYARRRGNSGEDARDLVQSYFVRLIDKRFLDNVRPEFGRFRAFLLHTMKNFISGERARLRAQRRGGGAAHLPLDLEDAENRLAKAIAGDRTPEEEFDRNWALYVFDRVLARLRDEAQKSGRVAEFDKMKGFLTEGSPRGAYGRMAGEMGVTEGALKVAVHRLRRKFGVELRKEIAETVDDPYGVEDEIRYLFDALVC